MKIFPFPRRLPFKIEIAPGYIKFPRYRSNYRCRRYIKFAPPSKFPLLNPILVSPFLSPPSKNRNVRVLSIATTAVPVFFLPWERREGSTRLARKKGSVRGSVLASTSTLSAAFQRPSIRHEIRCSRVLAPQ